MAHWGLSRQKTKKRQTNVNFFFINPLKPNDTYEGRTAPLTSKVTFYVFIQQI
jgi:hypothetical protein